MSETKPRLHPARVPWQISPSVPYLRVQENGDHRPESVTFVGHFMQYRNSGAAAARGGVQIVHEPGIFIPSATDAGSEYRMVRLSLQGGNSYRISESFADLEVVREGDYDWTLVSGHGLRKGETVDQYLRRFQESWLASGLCPDPGIYEVERSKWPSEAGGGPGLQHLLLLGHDEYVEVLTAAWTWEPGQPVS